MGQSGGECVIKPGRARGEPEIGGPVLLAVNPGDAAALGRLAKEVGGRRHFLYNSALWLLPRNGAAICGPAVGAPMAALTLEKLVALGGRRFVLFGSCGALARQLAIGDVLLPAWATGSEGTSRHYPLAESPQAAPELRRALAACLATGGITAASGGVWTTDAPFRETKALVCRYQAVGVSAVDMELSALLTVAAYRQVELAAVMVVSDLLAHGSWQPGFASRPFKEANRAVSRALFEFCCEEGDG